MGVLVTWVASLSVPRAARIWSREWFRDWRGGRAASRLGVCMFCQGPRGFTPGSQSGFVQHRPKHARLGNFVSHRKSRLRCDWMVSPAYRPKSSPRQKKKKRASKVNFRTPQYTAYGLDVLSREPSNESRRPFSIIHRKTSD